MTDETRRRLGDLTKKLQECHVELTEIREDGSLTDVSGIFDFHAAVVSNSLSTAVLLLQLTNRLHDAKADASGPPQIVGDTPVMETEMRAPALTDTITAPDRERCELCDDIEDPAAGIPIRLCQCGRRIPRNRK